MKVLMFLAAILVVSQARSLRSPACSQLLAAQGYSANFNETIAHAIHSMTVEGLQLFNVKATERNGVPTVNMDRSSAQKVVPFAPMYPLGNDFKTREMNVVDKILSEIGNAHDGLGPNWSPVERIAHTFHMWDLWHRILDVYQSRVMSDPPTDTVCQCLLDVRNNGIYEAVNWVSNHYDSGTPITLLNRPIPKLTDSESWGTWKDRLLYYYSDSALYDAATYIYCATKKF